ncbi:MAG: class II glutamine amidotransferase [Ruminococcus sp.]|nr:class II glutamine amidotransferase [Ruminococcus sp.]
MCELLGFSGAERTDLAEVLRLFFAHSDKNPHGWGMMYEKNSSIIVREPKKASASTLLEKIMTGLPPQKTLLAHIRYATVGTIKKENCHPFRASDISGRVWTMIHNGTIYSGTGTYRYFKQQSGDTDSERLFMAFMDKINDRLGRGELSERERFALVSEFTAEHAPRNKLNLMLYDGDLLYVHKNMKNTLSCKKFESGLLFTTVPLDNDGWTPMPMAQLVAYRNGSEVYRGERHKGVFIPTLEYITALDAMNI